MFLATSSVSYPLIRKQKINKNKKKLVKCLLGTCG
jgi:hypothetical protein